jgi:hypothetical protein
MNKIGDKYRVVMVESQEYRVQILNDEWVFDSEIFEARKDAFRRMICLWKKYRKMILEERKKKRRETIIDVLDVEDYRLEFDEVSKDLEEN